MNLLSTEVSVRDSIDLNVHQSPPGSKGCKLLQAPTNPPLAGPYRVAFVPYRVVSRYVTACFTLGFRDRTNFTLVASIFSYEASVASDQSPVKFRRISTTTPISLEFCASICHV